MFSTMKKTYQKPEIEMVLTAQTLLQSTSSPNVDVDPGNPGVGPGEFEVKGQGSRGTHDVWDDDWSR